jgi:hypothetical protein
MKVILITIFAIALGACATGKAAGTSPADMTVEQHLHAAVTEERIAAAYRKRAMDLHGGKGTYSAEVAADEHDAIAKQHRSAAAHVDPSVIDRK